MSQPCRWNCMNAAFMLYEQAGRGRGRAGPGVTGARQDAPAPQTPNRETAEPRNREAAKHQSTLDPGFHDVQLARHTRGGMRRTTVGRTRARAVRMGTGGARGILD